MTAATRAEQDGAAGGESIGIPDIAGETGREPQRETLLGIELLPKLLAGQGASMAVGAACILGSELTATPSVRHALTNYASRVRPAILQKQAAGRRTARWFVPPSRFRIRARNLLMNVTSKPPFQWMITGPLRADGATVITRRDRERLAPHRVNI